MHVWKYKPDLLDPPDHEEEDQAIIEYLRHGGVLRADGLGDGEKHWWHSHPDPRHILVSRAYDEPEKIPQPYKPKLNLPHPWEPEFIGPPRPPEHRVSRCINCYRSVPFNPSKENVCSKECQEALDNYRERVLTWMGMK